MELVKFDRWSKWKTWSCNFIVKVCKSGEEINIALSGGSTPQRIYSDLSRWIGVDFLKVKFFQVDERYVPKDDENSNYKMIYENLIKPLSERRALNEFHYFDTSLEIPKCLETYANHIEPFDLVVLGMGTDGHIASLFPHSEALKITDSPVAHTTTEEHAVRDRLTITLPQIMESKKILLLLKGEDKQEILDDLLNSSKSVADLPAKALLLHKDLTIYYLPTSK